jgi:hypothetical protein
VRYAPSFEALGTADHLHSQCRKMSYQNSAENAGMHVTVLTTIGGGFAYLFLVYLQRRSLERGTPLLAS